MAIGSLTFGWALFVRRAIFKVAKKKTLGPCSLSMVGGRGGGSVSERNLYIARSASPYQTETSQSYRRPHPLPPSPNLRSFSCTQASPHTQPQRLSPTALSGASFTPLSRPSLATAPPAATDSVLLARDSQAIVLFLNTDPTKPTSVSYGMPHTYAY